MSVTPGGPSPTGEAPSTTPAPVAGKPDIVVIMVDDVAQMDDRVWERMPTIKRTFLDHGVRFSDYVGNDPLCCPGRANFLSGQWAHHHGVVRNDARLFDPRETIATELQSQGYWTAIVGKYFNGTNLLANKFPPGWNHALIMSGTYWGPTFWRDGQTVRFPRSTYSTNVITRQTAKWIGQAPKDHPLFLDLTPFAVHAGKNENGSSVARQPSPPTSHVNDPRCKGVSSWDPPSYNEPDRSDKPAYVKSLKPLKPANGWPLKLVCETMLSVDDLLASTQAALAAAGRNNVMFILTDDNGMAFGEHAWPTKDAPYATPMPLFVRWDSQLGDKTRTIDSTITNVDLAPTLCAIAGCEMGPYPNGFGADGQSFLGVLEGTAKTIGRQYVLEEYPVPGPLKMPSWSGVRSTDENALGRWVYTEYVSGECELYDLKSDPWELRNRCNDPQYTATQSAMATELAQLRSH